MHGGAGVVVVRVPIGGTEFVRLYHWAKARPSTLQQVACEAEGEGLRRAEGRRRVGGGDMNRNWGGGFVGSAHAADPRGGGPDARG